MIPKITMMAHSKLAHEELHDEDYTDIVLQSAAPVSDAQRGRCTAGLGDERCPGRGCVWLRKSLFPFNYFTLPGSLQPRTTGMLTSTWFSGGYRNSKIWQPEIELQDTTLFQWKNYAPSKNPLPPFGLGLEVSEQSHWVSCHFLEIGCFHGSFIVSCSLVTDPVVIVFCMFVNAFCDGAIEMARGN